MSPLALLLAGALAIPGTAVRGRVVEAETGDPVVHAAVQLTGADYGRYAFTDSTGGFEFADVPAGRFRLDVTHPGYAPSSVRFVLTAGPGVELEVPIPLRPVPSPGITVVERRAPPLVPPGDPAAVPDSGPPAPAVRWLTTGPQSASALSDMAVASAAARPPDRQGRDGAHVLYLWGSSGDQGRVLLDGAALAAPLHLGGLLAPLDPLLLQGAEPRTGGASPRFDGGTTQVMEFVSRTPRADRHRGWVEADLIAGRVGLETGFGDRGAVLVGGRRIHAGLVERVTDRAFGYGYGDLLLRGDWLGADTDAISTTGFASEESIEIPRDFEVDRAQWRNLAGAARWLRTLPDGERSVALSASRATARLPLLTAPEARVESEIERVSLAGERTTRGETRTVTIGAEVERLGFARDAWSPVRDECAEPGGCFDEGVTVVSPWGQLAVEPRPGIEASGGVRLAWNAAAERLDLLPRARIAVSLDEATAVSASAGRYSRATILVPGGGPLANDPVLTGPEPAIARATHLELSLTRRTPASALSAVLYARRHDRLGQLGAHVTPGLDLWWAHFGPLGATSVGYSLARYDTPDSEARVRHVLSASYDRSVGPVQLHLASAWARGLPFVSVVLDDPDDIGSPFLGGAGEALDGAGPEPPGEYVRLDATISADWTLRWRGRPTYLVPYLKLMNALDRRDALFYFQESGPEGAPRPLAAVPILPVVGLRWSF